MKATDICLIIFIAAISITIIMAALALTWAVFEDTEIGQMITERFKERWKDDA